MNFNKAELEQKIKDEEFVNQVTKTYFSHYDENANRFIEKNELLKVMRDISKSLYGCEPEKGAVEFQFEQLDKDKNNKIDISEFKSFIRDYLEMIVNF